MLQFNLCDFSIENVADASMLNDHQYVVQGKLETQLKKKDDEYARWKTWLATNNYITKMTKIPLD